MRQILQIAELPEAWPRCSLDRRARVRQLARFRYSIDYPVSADAITDVAISHTSREPGYGLGRLP
ncbi:MAG TPA: hypothetical protein VFT22_05830 [Kofleriaceae bacterium]|nr:hypothetical protein [Kofleriaceae bacterium]